MNTTTTSGDRPRTLAEKVWEAHLVKKGEDGTPDLIYIDLHLVHEVTSPQAFDGLRLAGRPVRRPDLTIATEDHNTPTLAIDKPIADLTSRTQIETLRRNAFFPVVQTELPTDLTGAIALEAQAVRQQQRSAGALLALPPVGLGAKEGEVSQIFKNCFQEICLNNSGIQPVLDRQASELNTILRDLNVPCWAPDPISAKCEVA